MLVFSMTTTHIHYLKADTCKKNKMDDEVPFPGGVVSLLHVALGFSAASVGNSGHHCPAKVHRDFVVSFPLTRQWICLPQGWHKDHKREVVIIK